MQNQKLIDNSIVICPKSESKRLIAFKSKNMPDAYVKFLDKKELLSGIHFEYGLEAIDYVARNCGYSLENADELIRNSFNVSTENNKLAIVNNIKNDLIKANLLKINHRFKLLFVGKKIIVSGYSEKDKELRHALNLLGEDFEFVSDHSDRVERTIHSFEEIDDEVLWTIEKIYSLVESGVDLNNIFIYKLGSDYSPLFKRYSRLYNLPIQFDEDRKLADSPIFHKFLNLIEENGVEESYEIIKEKYSMDKYDAIGKLAYSINKCSFAKDDLAHFKELLSYVARNTKLRSLMKDPSIKMVDKSFRADDNQYVFVLGFSLGTYPRVFLDNDFYSDEEKAILNLNDSKTNSIIEEETLIEFLNANKNLIITRRRSGEGAVFYDSPLKEKLRYSEILENVPRKLHSSGAAKIKVGKAKDMLRLYNLDSEYIDTYSDKKLDYMSYDPSFKGIGDFSLPKKFHLSYTAINELNKCPFQFYLKRILQLKTFDSNFYSNLGTLFHQILQDSEEKDVDLNDYTDFVAENFLSEQEKFFVDILLPQVLEVIKKNKAFMAQTKFNHSKTEKEFVVDIDEEVKFIGKIDKLLIDEECKNIAIVDYKTSDFSYDDEKASHGIDMQLPIYAYLLSEECPEYRISGLYIQNVLFDKLKTQNSKRNYDPYLLSGFTLYDVDVARRLDTFIGTKIDENGELIQNSEFIKNITLTSKGVLQKDRSSTLVDDQFLSDRIELTKSLISLALKNIRDGNFEIKPFLESQNLPCSFCGCKDVCFVRKSDYFYADSYYKKVEDELSKMNSKGDEDGLY